MILSWQYGLLKPLDWGDDCETQITLQNRLWNKLVEIEKGHRGAVDALQGADPAVAEIQSQIDAIDAELAGIAAERKRLRQETRRRVETAVDPDEIAAKRDRRRVLYAEIKERRSVVREEKREQLAALSEARYRAVTTARQQSGLWWGNSNAVIAAFDIAAREAIGGKELRFRRYTGEGRLTNQIQGGITADKLMADGHSQITLRPDPTDPRRLLFSATVYTRGRGEERRMVTWPLILHRPFPEGAVIKSVTVNRRPLGPAPQGVHGWRWTVSLTCQVPDPEADQANRPACGIDLGWRQSAAGLRVAVIAGEDGHSEMVELPEKWIKRRNYAAELAGSSDLRLPSLSRMVREAMPSLPPALQALAEAAFPSGGKPRHDPLRRLAMALHAHRDSHGELSRHLDYWLRERVEINNLLDKLTAHRRDLYRQAAKRITERYGAIGIDHTPVGKIGTEETELPAVARQRVWAAPAVLASEIRRAARMRSCRVIDVGGATTMTCAECSHVNRRTEGGRMALRWQCSNCGAIWDQDENAARNVLAQVLSSASVPDDENASKSAPIKRARLSRKTTARKVVDNPLISA